MNTQPERFNGPCRQCGKRVRVGMVTCGKSECQEAEYHANKLRSRAGRKRKK